MATPALFSCHAAQMPQDLGAGGHCLGHGDLSSGHHGSDPGDAEEERSERRDGSEHDDGDVASESFAAGGQATKLRGISSMLRRC